MEHTKKLKVKSQAGFRWFVQLRAKKAIAIMIDSDFKKAEANAHRLVACWNACSRMKIEYLEQGIICMVNENLLEACKDLIKALNNCPGEFNYDPKIEDRARQAIAEAEKGK